MYSGLRTRRYELIYTRAADVPVRVLAYKYADVPVCRLRKFVWELCGVHARVGRHAVRVHPNSEHCFAAAQRDNASIPLREPATVDPELRLLRHKRQPEVGHRLDHLVGELQHAGTRRGGKFDGSVVILVRVLFGANTQINY